MIDRILKQLDQDIRESKSKEEKIALYRAKEIILIECQNENSINVKMGKNETSFDIKKPCSVKIVTYENPYQNDIYEPDGSGD